MKVDFLEFEESHLSDLGEHANQMFLATDSDFGQLAGVTVTVDDETAFIMGIAPFRTGVWDVVLIPGELFYSRTKTCLKQVKSWLANIQNTVKWHRIQATARADSDHHRRFLQCLGFKEEGRLRRYSPEGYDMYMYSLIKEDE